VAAFAALAAFALRTLTAELLRNSAEGDVHGMEAIAKPEDLPWDGNPLEPEAMDWMAGLDLPVIDRALATTPDEAAAARQCFSGPLAMKIVSPEILHKSDVGGVVLGLETEAEVRAAFERLRGLVAPDAFVGILITPMVADPVEAIVGLSTDPQFGPVIAVGLGGIFTETMRDLSLRVAPVSEVEARSMIDELRGRRLFDGTRGRPPCDADALAATVARVSRLPFAYPDIRELDLNPIFCLERGCAIADVRLLRGAASIDEQEDVTP